MIERLTENVFRALPNDVKAHLTELFEELRDNMMCDFSYIVATKKKDGRINGASKYIDGIENDYRSWFLIIVKPNAV